MNIKKLYSEVIGDYSASATRRAEAPGNIRPGTGNQVLNQRTSVLLDDQSEKDALRQNLSVMPQIALVFLTKGNKILAVSRGKDLLDFNIPGGHVEPGEDLATAAKRELYEETGIEALKVVPVYSAVCGGKMVTTFRAVNYKGKIKSSPEGTAAWLNPEDLMNGRYSEYFIDLIGYIQ